jgi:hypothetical protein
MADRAQLDLLKQGIQVWNAWRNKQPRNFRVDLTEADLTRAGLEGYYLSEADLSGAQLKGADLSFADLRKADLSGAILHRATLGQADLSKANLHHALLDRANFTMAKLCGANLSKAQLSFAILNSTDLSGADLDGAMFAETVVADVNLSVCKNLGSIQHSGTSPLDLRTLRRSRGLPLTFLRGVGLPEKLIEYLPSILDEAIQHYSCFISYASKDDDFARRLHADLQDKGVRCWFAPHDMKIGAKILDTLDEAIRLRDKVLLVLSEASIASDWVEDEVTKAFAEERQRGGPVLF